MFNLQKGLFRFIKIFLVCITCLSFTNIHAATYDFVSVNYEDIFDTRSGYTTAMNVSGSITTSSPLPPNNGNLDISGLITGFSFNDGLQTIDDSNGFILSTFGPVSVVTDPLGNIDRVIASWIIYPAPEFTSAPVSISNGILISNNSASAISNFECMGPSTATAICGTGSQATTAQARTPQSSTSTNWSIRAIPSSPTAVPSLNQWGIILLVLLLGFVTLRQKISRH